MKYVVVPIGRLIQRIRSGIGRLSSRESLAQSFEQSPLCSVMADASSLRIVAANEALRQTSGYSNSELLALRVSDIFQRDSGALEAQLRNPSPRLPIRAQLRIKNGAAVDVEICGYPVNASGKPLLAFISQDITLRNRLEARVAEKQDRLDHLAHHDALTGLPNRLFLAAHLPNAIEAARRSRALLAILFLDLDRFKHINDSRGHAVGDRLLQEVAQRIRAVARATDFVVHMSGDEFVIVLRSVANQAEIDRVASRVVETLSNPFSLAGHSLSITVSVGVSIFPRDGSDMAELLQHSDAAMYCAKDRGRNNCQMFSPLMSRRQQHRTLIETDLHDALACGQLDVHYQPIVDLASQRIVALESLLRWKHPKYGQIPPSHFIDIAEETGMIVPIGEFVLERVFADAARWRDSGGNLVPIAVNISARQLQRSNLHELISARSHDLGFKPSLLQIELTESTIFERREGRTGELNRDAVTRLRDLGVHIAIDDFGTGYSSLSYLKNWRVDSLKIDRSFVRDLVTDPSDLAIVSAITAMARHLNVSVTAEGIEGWQQLAKLRELGCQTAQGYLFSRALPANDCLPYLYSGRIDLARWNHGLDKLESSGLHPALFEQSITG